MNKKDIGTDVMFCPECQTPLDRHTLYNNDCMCINCGYFMDIDEYEEELKEAMRYFNNFDDNYFDDYNYSDDDYYIEMMKKRTQGKGSEQSMLPVTNDEDADDIVATFAMKFLTSASYEVIKNSFEKLDGEIDFLVNDKNGILTKFVKETDSGKKLAKGLDIEIDKLDEYDAVVSVLLGDKDDSKKILISTLCEVFPLCAIREEESYYIMTNNKGLAKGLFDIVNEDEIELLSLFLTGFEKYKILCNYLYWCEPYRVAKATDVMLLWENSSLISLDTLRKSAKAVPSVWQLYLETVEGIQVSKDKDDNGTFITFESMLEDVVDRERNTQTGVLYEDDVPLVQIVSLRGIKDYTLGADGDDEDDTSKK